MTTEKTEEWDSETAEAERTASVYQTYRERTSRSRKLFDRAQESMPGGNTRGAVYYPPYPVYIAETDGFHVTDVDGNEYFDFVNNMTTLIHGHAPTIVESAVDNVKTGSALGGPTQVEIEWAEHLRKRVPAVEQIRFTNSGTEATMNAIRAARAHTGNDVIAKFEGIYHGTHDAAQISVHPPTHLAGPVSSPNSIPDSAGIPESTTKEILTLPYNDADAALALLKAHQSDLAGVILCPIMGSSVVPVEEEFLNTISEFTSDSDVPLIFDEIISFRLAHGGAHAMLGVEPDLVTFGKVIGGGYPVGAFGGRADLLSGYNPQGGSDIVHSGTFNANPVTAAAGLAALEAYDEAAVEQVNKLGAELAQRSRKVIADNGLSLQVNQMGSLYNMYLSDTPVRSYRDKLASSKELKHLVHLGLLNEGIRIAPKLMGAISTSMNQSEVDQFVNVLDSVLNRLKPEFETRSPNLVDD